MEAFKAKFLIRAMLGSCCLFSQLALAGPDQTSPTLDYGVNSKWGWHIGAGVDYLKFSNNGSVFAESPTRIYNIDTDYHAGFNLNAGFKLPGRESVFDIDYTHIHTSDSSKAWGTPSLSPTDTLSWVNGRLSFDYDSLDVTVGHPIRFARDFGLNMYGGLNYTHLARDMTTWTDDAIIPIRTEAGTNFNGVGPTFGLDGYCQPFYDRLPNFTVIGGINSSLLYGSMSGYVRIHENDVLFSDKIPNENTVVPSIGGRLALDYGFPMRDYKLNAQLGYQVNQYFNVTRESEYISSTNASYQGFYFNLNASF